MKYIIDVDDLCETNYRTALNMLCFLKNKFENFKVTAFTIPALCNDAFFSNMYRTYPWISMVPHGLFHQTARECESWNYEKSVWYLRSMQKNNYLVRGFKAPGWNISDGMYKACLEEGYWVADHPKNKERRPKGLMVYDFTEEEEGYTKLHFHVDSVCGNGLKEAIEYSHLHWRLKEEDEFYFVGEYLYASQHYFI